MRIHADDAGDVRDQGQVGNRFLGVEHLVQPRDKFVVAAQFGDQAGNIVQHEEVVLPGVGLGVFVEIDAVHFFFTERRHPASVRIFAAHEAGGRIKNILPILRTLGIFFGQIVFAERLGQPRDAGIVVGIFQDFGDALHALASGNETLVAIGIQAVRGFCRWTQSCR